MSDGNFKMFFWFVVVVGLFSAVVQFGFGAAMYEECREEGKSKVKCLKEVNREIGGRGQNISIEVDE